MDRFDAKQLERIANSMKRCADALLSLDQTLDKVNNNLILLREQVEPKPEDPTRGHTSGWFTMKEDRTHGGTSNDE